MTEKIYQIYDKIFKKILTLSSKAVINMINGLFETNYPLDSTITYNWTEFEDDKLRRTLADTILTINGRHSYHMEAQMYEDGEIVFRVFAYGYQHADRDRVTESERCILNFPEPKIIYLYAKESTPPRYVLELHFGQQGIFPYTVPVVNLTKMSAEEMNKRKLIILIPFHLLKLKDLLKKDRSPENLKALQNLIQTDIIGSINKNLALGNISMDDARRLRNLTGQLYDYLYAHYDEMEAINMLTDESLLLEYDIIEMEHEKALAEKDRIIQEKDNALQAKDSILQEQADALQASQLEIQRLKAELEKLSQR